MKVRRFVTGTDQEGRAVFTETGYAPNSPEFAHTPGFGMAALWETPSDPRVPATGGDASLAVRSYMPSPGRTLFVMLRLPPLSVMTQPEFDPVMAGEEQMRLCPGIADRFEPDHPGMHTTDTIDYGVVLSGEVWLELDDRRKEMLKAGDTFVQNGTRHAWRNLSNSLVVMSIVSVGATRDHRD